MSSRRTYLLLALTMCCALSAGADDAELRQRAAELFERREQARLEGGISLDQLGADLITLADELETAGLDSLAAGAHHRAAGVLLRIDRRDDAIEQLRQGREAAERAGHKRSELSIRSYMAELQRPGDPLGAIATIRDLLPELEATGLQRMVAGAYSTEANAWLALGRAEESLAAARRARDGYRADGSLNNEAYAMGQMSQALRFLNRHAEALLIADELIELGAEHDIGRALSRGYLERASCLRSLGRYDEGLTATQAALTVDRRLGDRRHERSVRRFRIGLLLDSGRFERCVVEADSLVADAEIREDPTLLLFASALGCAARIELGQSALVEERLRPPLEGYELYRAQNFDDEDLAASAQHGRSSYTVLARALLEQGRVEEAWRAAERGRAFALKRQLTLSSLPSLDDVLAELAASKAALIQFEGAVERLGTAFVLSEHGVRAVRLDGSVTQEDFERGCDLLVDGRVDDQLLQKMSTGLLGELWGSLPKGIERIVFVAPIEGSSFPLEALPIPADTSGSRIADRFAISYAPSSLLLPYFSARAARSSGILVLADPSVDWEQPSLATLDETLRKRLSRPLPGAREEALELERRGASVLVGAAASLQNLRQAQPAVLHLATHAFEDRRLAPRGALLLAGDPGLLTVETLDGLRTSSDLVTLSACQTLGSRSYPGEGAFGLARAFLRSGARSVVTARWEVSDRAAARFMAAFYTHLAAGLARDAALARAGAELEAEEVSLRDRWAFLLLGSGRLPLSLE